MKIHALSTGQVRIKQSALYAKGSGAMRMLHILQDTNWTDWLPIYVWVIEHPEGVIVVDSGERSVTTASPIAQFRVRLEDEIGVQLERLNIGKSDIRCVVQTHLHGDHVNGLSFFSGVPVLVSLKEWQSQQGLGGWLNRRVAGMVLPPNFQPQMIAFESGAANGIFEQVHQLTRDGAVRLVSTPGHTLGHVSVIVHSEGVNYFLAGDASYTQVQMLECQPSGLSSNETLEKQTHQRILRFALEQPTVYLPSHDPESALRLEKKQIIASTDPLVLLHKSGYKGQS